MEPARITHFIGSVALLLIAAGCGAAEPRAATGAAPQPLPPADPSCAEPATFGGCAPDDAPCIERQQSLARVWNEWTLRCQPVQPAHPIAGEEVELTIPHPPGGRGACTAGGIEVQKFARSGETLIQIENATTGNCGDNHGLSMVSLGALAPGKYRVDTGYWETSFVVRPAGSDPGDLPKTLRAAIAVAEEHDPGRCFGMPPGDEVILGTERFGKMRVAHQMQKAFPKLSLEELERLHRRASAMGIDETGPGRWTYSFSDGACCTINQVRGTLVRDGRGKYTVGPATVIESKNVPC